MRPDVDVAILGAGFGGSLCALLLERIGLRAALIDRGSHPRFAIGESSTPTADLVLRDLARTYGLPRLEPLAKYGTWQAAWPELGCGLKRGFSYFKQQPDRPFTPTPDHANELLVAASADDLHADTHWLRSDVDGFLAAEAQRAGVLYLDRTQVTLSQVEDQWHLAGERAGQALSLTARFLIDATGEGGALPRALGFGRDASGLRTNSRALFGHFANVRPWRDLLAARGGAVAEHPFDCDSAALHQVLDEGWMWQLRFNNGITSAGFALDATRCPLDPQVTPAAEWDRLMQRYPSLAEQFQQARLVQPAGGLQRTGRLQRLAQHIAGPNWVLLPHSAGFIDPLHSTGIAHTLCGIERLVGILVEHFDRPALPAALQQYERIVRAEIALIDALVHGCYRTLRRFDLLVPFSMLYFAAATTYERRRLAGALRPGAAFLCADAPEFADLARAAHQQLDAALVEPDSGPRFEQFIARAIAPFNSAGLCDPRARHMYRYTAVPPTD